MHIAPSSPLSYLSVHPSGAFFVFSFPFSASGSDGPSICTGGGTREARGTLRGSTGGAGAGLGSIFSNQTGYGTGRPRPQNPAETCGRAGV